MAGLAAEAVCWLATGEHEKTAHAVGEIIRRGPVAVHGAVLGWSRYTHDVMTGGQEAAPGEMWAMGVASADTGEEVGADALGTPALKGAVALLTCAANSDHGSIEAIISAAIDGGGAEALGTLMLQCLNFAAAAALEAHGEEEVPSGG